MSTPQLSTIHVEPEPSLWWASAPKTVATRRVDVLRPAGHLGARASALAGAGAVLVSRTVRDHPDEIDAGDRTWDLTCPSRAVGEQ
jgi:hypothetical protein